MLFTAISGTNLSSDKTCDANANLMAIPLLLDVVATKGANQTQEEEEQGEKTGGSSGGGTPANDRSKLSNNTLSNSACCAPSSGGCACR
jgi:hypothetical protein